MNFSFDLKALKMTPEGKKYIDELNKLQKLEVAVGFQAGASSYEDGTDVVEVAAYNEYGTSTIPARPFMKQSFDNHEDELHKMCEHVIGSLMNGESTESALNTLGVYLKGLVQEEIVSGDFAPNAPSTIKKKGSATPLIDTGQMRQSVNYVVREVT